MIGGFLIEILKEVTVAFCVKTPYNSGIRKDVPKHGTKAYV